MRSPFVRSTSSGAPIRRQRSTEHNLGRPADNNCGRFYVLGYILTFSDRDNKQLKLTPAFGSLGTRSLLGLFDSLGRLLGMLYGSLLVSLVHRSIVFSGPLGAGSALGLFRTFGRLSRLRRPLFAHGASLSVRPSTFLVTISKGTSGADDGSTARYRRP